MIERSNAFGTPTGHRNLERLLDKDRQSFTKQDLLKFIVDNEIQLLNFRFIAGDGRIKTFSFVTSDWSHLDRVLSTGERVDGSSLFRTVDAGSSDLYIVPRYTSAFVNPFSSIPAVDVLCSFFTHDGTPLPNDPEFMVRKAQQSLKDATGFEMETLAELEYYLVTEPDHLFPACAQKGYGESQPFGRWEQIRTEAMVLLGQMGFSLKYGHSEVGQVSDQGRELFQHEIEFNLMPPNRSADAVVVARWVLRMLAKQHGLSVTFSPKLVSGHAGSGLHIHTRLVKDGKSVIGTQDGLTDVAHRVLAGYLEMAPAITAFGNPSPVSFLRLVPNQEAPVYICWGKKNRSALIRVPLGWNGVKDMARLANPQDPNSSIPEFENQTLEVRSPDGAADSHLLHASLVVAARRGLQNPDALELANSLYVGSNIFKGEDAQAIRDRLPKLPMSCGEAAVALNHQRKHFEVDNVFTPATIDGVISLLNSFEADEAGLRSTDARQMAEIVERYLHCS